jgi:short-subunit dehydrogenase
MNLRALVTGASGGIGYELALIHARQGYDLILAARNKFRLDEISRSFESDFGVKIHTVCIDLSVQGASVRLYEEVNDLGLNVDHLVNNAGFGDVGMFADCDWKKQEDMINLNVLALTHLTKLFLPGMIERGYGRILNVASTAAFQPGPTMSVYFASKAFVLSFSEAVNNELEGTGVTVTALCPGSTESGFHAYAAGEGRKFRERTLPAASSVAEYGFRSMMHGKPVAIPGFMNAFMAGCVRFMPRSVVVRAARMIQERKHNF